MPRFAKILATAYDGDHQTVLFAVAEDGTLWRLDQAEDATIDQADIYPWTRLPDLPTIEDDLDDDDDEEWPAASRLGDDDEESR